MYNKSNEFLDIAYNKQLREAINSSPLYAYDENHKSIYNLSCAVMDRLNSCILYLNSHASTPSTEEDFISFMVFACMTIDATKQLLKGLNTKYSLGNEKKYFKNVCEENNFILPNSESPTDDEFFLYFRALVFAHPLETSRAKFLEKGEIEYSPWVIVNNDLASLLRVCDIVGVRVYSNKYTEIRDITFSFSKLKGYISARYKLIKCAINAINNEVTAKQEEFRKDKINRNQSPVEILNEIKEKLENRFREYMKLMI
jgi:hypothetical protein